MKNLKFIFVFFVFFVFAGLVSCGSDDDGNDLSEGDRIVGVWNLQSQTIAGDEWELSECELQSTINFSANGNITVTDYSEVTDHSEDCVSEVYTQRWEYRGNNIYRITEEGRSQNVTIIFSNNNNSFTITAEDGTYAETYVRV